MEMLPPINTLAGFCRKMAVLAMLACLVVTPRLRAAPETNGPAAVSDTVITNLAQFWELPEGKRNQLHRVQMKLLVFYCDRQWSVFWGASDDLSTFLPFRGLPVPLKAGDEIFIDGSRFR